MSSAPNSSPAQPRPTERSNDPSMEEILASIRRIIADDQALPINNRDAAPAVAVKAAPAASIATAAPTPVAAPKVAAEDGDFEAWLSETATNAAKGKSMEPVAKARTEPVADMPFVTTQAARPEPVVAPVRPVPVEAPAAVQRGTVFDGWDEDLRPASGDRKPEDIPRLSVVSRQEADAVADGVIDQADDALSVDGDDELDTPVAAMPSSSLLSSGSSTSVSSSFQALAQTVMMQNSGMIEQSIRDMLRPMLKQWLDDNLPTMVERLVRAEIERVARGGP